MSNIRKNVNNIFDLRITRKNFWDFQLSQDNIQCYNCDEIISGDVITTLDFNNISGVCSEITWDEAISFSGDVCDIGLTGVDNRFVDNFSGETFNPSGDTRFCVKRVSGDTYCYDMSHIMASGDTPEHVQFCGGFFQGFYKLHEYDYSVLPNFYPQGWTKEFWINSKECPSGDVVTVTGESIIIEDNVQTTQIWSMDIITGGTCEEKPTLNEVYPDNKGIFYYWGLRAENKFCIFSPLSGLTTCTGIPLAPEFTVVEFKPDSPFLYYNRKQLCEPQPNPTVEFTDCCDGLLNNALAFRITDEGEIGVRLLTTTGECVCTEDSIQFSGTPIIEEFYSTEGIIQKNVFHKVTYRFTPYDTGECEGYRIGYGSLSIFVDSLLKLKIDDFPEFMPYALCEHKDKQLGVPYNISIGGGTQGLLESIPSGDSELFGNTGYTACDYVTNLVEPCVFGGISINGEEILSPPLTVDEPELIQMWLEMYVTRRQGDILVLGQQFNRRKALRIEINGVIDTLDYIVYANNAGQLHFCNPRCYDVPPHDGKCGILEEHFAGTFIGGIASYRLHDRPLCFSEIQCNWNIEKEKYGRTAPINPCNT